MATLGPYTLGEQLGEGGMAKVYGALHRLDGRRAAVKVETSLEGRAHRGHVLEVQIMARLHHQNCVRIFDTGVVSEAEAIGEIVPGTSWIAMELASGGPLTGRPPREYGDVLHVLDGLLQGLAHAHARGVIHRDIKANNILLDRIPGTLGSGLSHFRIVLADFGVSTGFDRSTAGVEAPMGTPIFMAPEQCSGEWRLQGSWTDLYQVSVLTWRLVTGRYPFECKSDLEWYIAHLQREPEVFEPRMPVPDGLEAWCRALLAKDPLSRAHSAARAWEALRELGLPTTAPTVRPAPPPEQETAPTEHVASSQPSTGPSMSDPVGGLLSQRQHRVCGRFQERHLLTLELAAVESSGLPRLVALEGLPGMGKSRLASWIGELALESGRGGLWRVGDSWTDAIRTELHLDGLDRDALAALVRRRVRDLGVARAVVRYLTEDAAKVDFGPVLAATVASIARELPLVVIVDGAPHPEGLALLAASDLPLLIVSTHPVALPHTAITLGPMNSEDLATLGGDIGVAPALAFELECLCAGNPGIARQVLGAWAADGHLRATPKGLAWVGEARPSLPDLDAVWASRVLVVLEDCGSQVRRAMGIAACLGDRFVLADWRAAVGDPAVDEALEICLSRSLLVLPGGEGREVDWVHPLARQVVLDRHGEERMAWCREVLDRIGPTLEPSRRARLAEWAGRLDEAFEAQRRYVRSLNTAGDTRSELPMVELERLRGLAPGDSAQEKCRRHGEVMLTRARFERARGYFLDPALLSDATEVAAGCGDPHLRARLTHAFARAGGTADEMLRRLRLAKGYYLDAGDLGKARVCDFDMADLCRDAGRVAEALATLAPHPWDIHIPDREQFRPSCERAQLALSMGDLETAERELRASIGLAKKQGMTVVLGTLLGLEGDMFRQQGRLKDALQRYSAHLLTAQRLNRRFEIDIAHVNLAMTHVALGDWEGASAMVAMIPPQPDSNPWMIALQLTVEMCIELAAGGVYAGHLMVVEHLTAEHNLTLRDIAALCDVALSLEMPDAMQIRVAALREVHRPRDAEA